MPTQEDEKKPKVETPTEPETPEQAAARAAGIVQEGKEKQAAAALVGAENAAPVAERAKEDPAAKAREIAQRYLETIPEADRKLTDPKQVKCILTVLQDAQQESPEDRSHLFSSSDKVGNPPERIGEARIVSDTGRMAKGWREFAADPVGVAKETDKVKQIANSTLPESVRTAILSIILKEGDYSAVDMARDIAEMMEKANGHDWDAINAKYHDSPEAFRNILLRQKVARELINGLYPELMQSDGVKLFLDIKKMSFAQNGDRQAVAAVVERYNQVLGGEAAFAEQIGGASNGAELLARLNDGGNLNIEDKGILGKEGQIQKSDQSKVLRELVRALSKEVVSNIVKKATSAEVK